MDMVEKEELPYLTNFRKLSAKQLKIRKRKADEEAKEAEEMAQ